MRSISAAIAATCLLCVAPWGCAQGPSTGANAPDFVGAPADWINSKPLSLKDLEGKVVLVDFWEYTCINCVRTFPYLKAWYAKYHDKGLVIVGVHTPEFRFAHDRANVAKAVKRFGLPFPILVDSDYKNWDRYDTEYWPRKYLLNGQGVIVADHAGEGDYEEFERKIQAELKKLHPNLRFTGVTPPIRTADMGGDMYPVTPEMYAGARGASEGIYGFLDYEVGKTSAFSIPSHLREGAFYLGGRWTVQTEFLESAAAGGKLDLHYRAKEVAAVLRPAEGPVVVEVLQDGKPLSRREAGADIEYRGGKSFFTLADPRMYALVNNAHWGDHTLTLKPGSSGFRIYSFAFASDRRGGA